MKILLCEDEVNLAEPLKEMFIINKYDVDVVHDGKSALNAIDKNIYDVIILDIMMPVINGIEVLKEIRKDNNDVHVIMLSSKSMIDDKVISLELGANDYVTKPYDFKELKARVNALGRKDKSVLKSSNLVLDKNNYSLSSDKGSYILSKHEFDIMYLLMSNKNVCETKIEMLIGSVEAIHIYINYLKKKLVMIGSNLDIIENDGYCLC